MAQQRVDASGQRAVSVTPSDANKLTMPSGTNYTKGIYIGVGGNISVKMADGSDIVFTNIAAGIVHPLSVVQVYNTSTTANGIIAVY